jgi:hypothetical protein
MENELNHWVTISQRTSGGVELDSVCRVGFALMASDPEHYAKVKHDHKEYEEPAKKALSIKGLVLQLFRLLIMPSFFVSRD